MVIAIRRSQTNQTYTRKLELGRTIKLATNLIPCLLILRYYYNVGPTLTAALRFAVRLLAVREEMDRERETSEIGVSQTFTLQ